ncbi:MAG: hypothetical protein DDT34_02082 [Firmicutes bacterium]|nr:hypothetical protein [Bacillota bacterium]MBT9166122.1 hypothetical protein [Chloroflexota bacterium]
MLAAIVETSRSAKGGRHCLVFISSSAASIAVGSTPCRRMAPAMLVRRALRCGSVIGLPSFAFSPDLPSFFSAFNICSGSFSHGISVPGAGSCNIWYLSPTILTNPPTPRTSTPGSSPATVFIGCPVQSTYQCPPPRGVITWGLPNVASSSALTLGISASRTAIWSLVTMPHKAGCRVVSQPHSWFSSGIFPCHSCHVTKGALPLSPPPDGMTEYPKVNNLKARENLSFIAHPPAWPAPG